MCPELWDQFTRTSVNDSTLAWMTVCLPLQMIREMMEEGSEIGFNVLRLWAHSVSPEYALQTSPGEYNEAVTVVCHFNPITPSFCFC